MTTPTTEHIAINRPEGTSFSVRWYAGPPGAPVVLVVPAMGVQAGYYSKLAPALHEAGMSVAVTELRGHEETGGHHGRGGHHEPGRHGEPGGRRPSRRYDFGYADLVADLGQAVDVVATRQPQAPVFLLGHSLGGHVGMVYAAQNPGTLAGLMLVATGSVWWRLWHRRMYAVGVFINVVTALLGYFPGHRVGLGGREARTQMRDWARFNRTGRLEFGTPRVHHDPAIATVDLPVLGVSLAGDDFAPPRALQGLLAKLPRASITRVHLGADEEQPPGHLRWARRPEVVIEHLVSWIGQQHPAP